MKRKISEAAAFSTFFPRCQKKNWLYIPLYAIKEKLRDAFDIEIKDEILSAHIYLLFESSIITSQLYRSNELIVKSKTILIDIIKNLN
jgi:hypothetical protein